MTDEVMTCGKGLADHSAIPRRLAALTAALADVLENHQGSLDAADANARAGNEAMLSEMRGAAH